LNPFFFFSKLPFDDLTKKTHAKARNKNLTEKKKKEKKK
jgi:hypothetical protein